MILNDGKTAARFFRTTQKSRTVESFEVGDASDKYEIKKESRLAAVTRSRWSGQKEADNKCRNIIFSKYKPFTKFFFFCNSSSAV